ncbi:MAG: nuclear transport factor 2 family protein [Planktomarina sp.]
MTHPNRISLQTFITAQSQSGDWSDAASAFFAADANINVVHPVNEVAGIAGYLSDYIAPLQTAFDMLHRRDYIAIAGEFEGREWVSATGYFCGHFHAPLWGINPTNTLMHLRFGEFHRMENGKAVESYIYLDLPELMIAAGQWPITESPGVHRGFTGYVQGPQTQDGLQFTDGDAARDVSSYDMVTAMLRSLGSEDEAWRPYWHDNMQWYGPAAFGTFTGIERFREFQVPFESAFEGWSGGASGNGMTVHATRFADGDYICIAGWPSLTGVHVKPFLGQPATGERVFMRVCDWWRRDGDKLVENWVFVDIPHVLLQLGYDVFKEIQNE